MHSGGTNGESVTRLPLGVLETGPDERGAVAGTTEPGAPAPRRPQAPIHPEHDDLDSGREMITIEVDGVLIEVDDTFDLASDPPEVERPVRGVG